MKKALLLAALIMARPAIVQAQDTTATRNAASVDAPRIAGADDQVDTTEEKPRAGRAVLLGALAWYAGAVPGAYAGAAVNHDCGGCDDPGLEGAMVGAAIGGSIAAGAVVAEVTPTRGRCTPAQRRTAGITGATLGTIGGTGVVIILGSVTGGIGFLTAPAVVPFASSLLAVRFMKAC